MTQPCCSVCHMVRAGPRPRAANCSTVAAWTVPHWLTVAVRGVFPLLMIQHSTQHWMKRRARKRVCGLFTVYKCVDWPSLNFFLQAMDAKLELNWTSKYFFCSIVDKYYNPKYTAMYTHSNFQALQENTCWPKASRINCLPIIFLKLTIVICQLVVFELNKCLFSVTLILETFQIISHFHLLF